MDAKILSFLSSSIGRKQIVAVTGLLLIGFVVGHLAGNLIIYLGPDAFNAYAKKLASLRPALYVVEAGLAGMFLVHMYFVAVLVLENIKSRPVGYAVNKSSEHRSIATKLMPYTGFIIIAFVIWHLLDFTFIDKTGPRSFLPVMNGDTTDYVSYGLFGVLYNSFSNPIHAGLYILAMIALGLHLSHGVESFVQTFGWTNNKNASFIKDISHLFATIMVVAYSSIPICILFGILKY